MKYMDLLSTEGHGLFRSFCYDGDDQSLRAKRKYKNHIDFCKFCLFDFIDIHESCTIK